MALKVKAEFDGKEEFDENKPVLYLTKTRSGLRGVDGVQLPGRSARPTQPLHPTAPGADTPGSTSLQQTLLVKGEGGQNRERAC